MGVERIGASLFESVEVMFVVISRDFAPYGFDLKVEMESEMRGNEIRCYREAIS